MLTEGIYLADRYEVVGKIGAGGMSDVYKAKDHTLGRFVAIKVLKQEFSEDVSFVTKFRTEAQSAAGLEHPNIVNIYDVGSENGMHYIVMEYVEGITLKTYIEKKGQLTFKEAVSIAIQVGRGIEAAHNKNIIHRDIKPQNIMISTEGKVKVTDFGIARAASVNTINSDVMGSVHYSSPEQARNGFVDGKSDIYSLGIVMYEMVTGRVPFDGDTTVSIAIQHLQEEMVKPSAYAPDLPISLEKIILKCTQKSTERRYESMSDLLIDLKKALISPNEDFVTMVLVNQDKTRVITDDELRKINEEREITDDDEEELEEELDEEEEEENDGMLNPKMEKAVTIMGIVAAIVIVIIVIFLVGNLFGIFNFGKKDKTESEGSDIVAEQQDQKKDENETVTMVDLSNKTYDEAKAALSDLKLGIRKDGTVASDTIEEGRVVEQSVPSGQEVEVNTTITVKLSSGASDFALPQVVGYEETAAIKILEDAGLKYSRDYANSDTVPSGTVISSSPEAGTAVKEGDTITIIVSQGKAAVQVPQLLDQTQDKVQQLLAAAGLNIGSVTTAHSDTVPEGYVISQDIVAGKYVEAGTAVSIVVSIGPEIPTYSFSTKITAPADSDIPVVAASIQLLDAQGNVIDSWDNVDIAQFGSDGYTISVTGITGSSTGTVYIEWQLEDGSVSDQEAAVTFTKE